MPHNSKFGIAAWRVPDYNKQLDISSKKQRIDFVILGIISIAVFFRSLNINFVGDDLLHIDYSWQSLKDVVFQYYRPLTNLSLFIDKQIWGYEPFGFHLTNLIVHSLNTSLVYLLAKKFSDLRIFAFVAGLFFLIHPIHSSSIFWISGRVDMLCTTFYLLAFLAFIEYTRFKTTHSLLLSITSFLLALLSKEMALSLPLVFTAYVLVYTTGTGFQRWKVASSKTWPFWVLAILFLIFKMHTLGFVALTNNVHTNLNPIHLLKDLATFIGLLIVPGWHITIANYLKAQPSVFTVLAAISIIALIVTARWLKRQKKLWFFALFVLLTLLPVLRLAMRWYLYLPSVGFCLGLFYLLHSLHQKGKLWKKISLGTTGLIIVTYVFFINVEQNRWLESGRLANRLSLEIARKIDSDKVDHCLILSVPGEYEETPVLMHGLESLVNFRLKSDFKDQKEVGVMAASLVSIRDSESGSYPELSRLDSNQFSLSLNNSKSYFVFPEQAELISELKPIGHGYRITQSSFDISIDSVNQFGQANVITIKITDTNLKLYQLNPNSLEPVNNVIDSERK